MIDWLLVATAFVALALLVLTAMVSYFLYQIVKSDDEPEMDDRLATLTARMDFLEDRVEALEDRVESLIEDVEYVS